MLPLYETAGAGDSSGWASNGLVLAVVAALLGFIGGYAIELVKSRRGPRTILSWDLKIEEPSLTYGAPQSDRIKVSYLGREVDRLVSVRCAVTNTGNLPIKSQFIRFAVPQDAEILRRETDPLPEPEMGVADLTGEDPAYPGPRYRIGHLDPGESVSFIIAADGGSWRDWNGVVLRNDENSVTYQRRDVAQRRDDQAHLGSFLFGIAAIFIITALAGTATLAIWIIGKFYLIEIVYFGLIVGVTIAAAASAAYLLSHARRATRSIAMSWIGSGRGQTSLVAGGGSSWFAYAPSGSIRIVMPDPEREPGT
ncbi:hypothetical protein ACIODS_32865 [Micromonospora chalcea]|uniref:hypothetical protein n=1 Tax=Micromonospora chalcea TaxID=1874 RepID=UPI00365789FD